MKTKDLIKNPRFHSDGREEHAIIGEFYLWKPTGAIVLCVSEDLEVFKGVVIKGVKAGDNPTKLGQVIKHCSTFNRNWFKLNKQELKKELES